MAAIRTVSPYPSVCSSARMSQSCYSEILSTYYVVEICKVGVFYKSLQNDFVITITLKV